MGEPEAIKAIKIGIVDINGETFTIEKEPHGWCDGCYFLDKHCPSIAKHICCTGGYILKKNNGTR